ncbi:MAG: HesA/MoeB/ThiF family protein [Bacteroidia bacterium]|nr:HesA/MoeB/ThiF family protein [Bacteroidia bacterium]
MRYSRQIQLPEFGASKQEKLSQAKVLIIGCGGLGTPIATTLAAMGIGKLSLMDGDVVAEENLHRQFQYNSDELRKMKATILSEKLNKQNPNITIEGITNYFSLPQGNSYIQEADLVIDTCDDLGSRIAISQSCLQGRKPLFYAAASGWKGLVMAQIPGSKLNLSDYLQKSESFTCTETGIFPPVLFWVSSLITTEIIRFLTEENTCLKHQLEIFDALQFKQQTFQLNNPANSYSEA